MSAVPAAASGSLLEAGTIEHRKIAEAETTMTTTVLLVIRETSKTTTTGANALEKNPETAKM